MAIDPGGPKRHALGVDFGTSNTVAVARWPDGRARPILVDGSPLLPSAVYAEADGTLSVGRDAVYSARLDPARFEPNPKRRIDDGLVLLGDRELPVVELIEAVLARVAEEWHRAVGPVRPDVTLTCPATWGANRRTLLADAAARAGLEGARLVAEPVAAATYFAEVLGRDVPIGSVVVVHDFGAGTFDASVVARTSSGFEVMAVDGRDDVGGLDVDAAIVEHLRADGWQRVLEPSTVEERRARRQLWDDVRIAKERLSRAQTADFVVPMLDTEVHLTRDELERLARPVLDQTVRITKGLIRWAALPEGRLAGVFLVGGASRIPLVATLLHRELGEAPVVIEQPELVVAEGSILADAALLTAGAASPGPTSEMRLVSTGLPEPARPEKARPEPGRSETGRSQAGQSQAGRSQTDQSQAGRSQAGQSQAGQSEPTPVHFAQARVPGMTGLQPAVDPWPDADPGHFLPDPRATVKTPKPIFDDLASRETVANSRFDRSATHTPTPAPAPRFDDLSSRDTVPARKPRFDRGAHPVPAKVSASSPPSRPVSPSPSSETYPVVRRAAAPPKRRTGRFARFLQIVISVIVMIVVPIAAMVVAYGYGNGAPIEADARNLLKDIANLLGIQAG